MSKEEPHIADFVGIGQWRHVHKYSETQNTIKRLKSLLSDIEKAEKVSNELDPCADELSRLVKDIAWETRAIDDAIDIIDEYEDVNFDDWYDEVEARLTPEEKEEFEQEKVIHKLKEG